MKIKSLLFFVIMGLAAIFVGVKMFNPSLDKWVGVWIEPDGENMVTITKNSNGTLHAEGKASFCCAQVGGEPGSDNPSDYETHYGSFVFDAAPKVDHLMTHDDAKVGCDVNIAIKGDTLIIDEHYCGGANVSFNGTYTRKQK